MSKRYCPTCNTLQVLKRWQLELRLGRMCFQYQMSTCRYCVEVLQAMISVGEIQPYIWWHEDGKVVSGASG